MWVTILESGLIFPNQQPKETSAASLWNIDRSARVVITKSSSTTPESGDLAVAEAARILYDFFAIHQET